MAKKITSYIVLFSYLFSLNAWAQEATPTGSKSLDYPELNVAPRASERLNALATWEQENFWTSQWTMMGSAVMTLFAAQQHSGKYRNANLTNQEKKDSDLAGKTGLTVGLAWIGLSSFMMYRHPAQQAASAANRMPSKDRRQELTKERYAEESLERMSALQDRLEILSIVSNVAASSYLLSEMHDDNKIYGFAALLGATLPVLFESEYIRQYTKHRESKRKIYSPLVMMSVDQNLKPVLALNWSF